MYSDENTFTADLLAFLQWQDLPPAFYPFAKCASWRNHLDLDRRTRVIILRIREAPDALHAIIVTQTVTMSDIEAGIRRELEVVELSEETRALLEDLLERSQRGEAVYYLSNISIRV